MPTSVGVESFRGGGDLVDQRCGELGGSILGHVLSSLRVLGLALWT